ncbi:very short patch repair endonuclease [Sedimentibacter sp. B4]|uniref:very short patch repair endonuclease n=1 Tax=Sedimentibacter sp. B4 TaxID=304766 RepID=UPI00059448CC|nr:DNA mismatch endonuclease Vsr [Sedimentibacter sp. B4]
MADVHSTKIRSYNMSMIHSKNTKPEEKIRKYLFSQVFRYRKNDNRLPGKPDIVLPKYKTVIFVNGCFWHKHDGCKYFVWLKSNVEFWQDKIKGNVFRDKKIYSKLTDCGWNVLVIWECELRKDRFESTTKKLTDDIRKQVK